MSSYMSKQDLIKELLKCGSDPVYFIRNYCKIAHPQLGIIPFKLWGFQEDLLRDYVNFRNNIINKSRQLGISTVSAAYCAWLMLFHEEKNIMVIATQFQVAQNLVKKVKTMIKQLDPIFKQLASINVDNRTNFELTNGSAIKASATNMTAGRSEALSLLVIDEAAHIEGLEELWSSLGPTMAAGGRCIALSSPNGQGGWFYDMWVDSEAGENDFHPTELMWDVHPDRDEDWFIKEQKKFSKREFAQEYLCSFNASGETVVDPDDIAWAEGCVTEPMFRIGHERSFWVWEKYDRNQKYIITADVARGDGSDFSTFHVFKMKGFEQVAEFRAKVNTDTFSRVLFDVGRDYGDALVITENNTYGHEVNNKLIDFEYPNLYWSRKTTHEYVQHFRAKYAPDCIAGFTMSPKTREWVIGKFEEYIRNKLVNVKSFRLLKEINTFIWRNGKAEAMKGKNDDLVMALGIACYVFDAIGDKDTKDVNFKKAAINAMISTSKMQTKLNTHIPGQIGYNKNLSLYKQAEQQQRQRKKFSWLFTG